MGFFSGTKRMLNHVFDFRFDLWADWPGIKHTSRYLWHQAKTLFSKEKPKYSETFQEATERLSLSNDSLVSQAKRYYILSFLFFMYAIFLIIYGGIILVGGNWIGGIISFSLSIYALALAFRFHFWRFQIIQQKLGCTVKEWSQSLIAPKRTTPL